MISQSCNRRCILKIKIDFIYYNIYMQKQELDIQEIIANLNHKYQDKQSMSLRFSEDYNPIYDRYSREDELQELTLILQDDRFSHENQPTEEEDFKISEETSAGRAELIIDEIKKEQPSPQQKKQQANKSLKISIFKKQSLKASERLKKKISLKSESDQFTKKYDDLFDQIFFKQAKQSNKENKQKSKSQDLTNNTLNIDSSSFGAQDVLDNVLDLKNQKEQNSVLNSVIPKIIVNYEEIIRVNILPPKQPAILKHCPIENIQHIQPAPKIKFSYGKVSQPTIIIKAKEKSSLSNLTGNQISHNQKEDQRLPIFLRQLRKKSNNYPNLYSKAVFTKQNCIKFNNEFTQIVKEFQYSIQTLKQCHLQIHQNVDLVRELFKKLYENIMNDKSGEDLELLKYFIGQNWQKCIQYEQLSKIKPNDVFLKRQFVELQFITFLHNFDEMVVKLVDQAILDTADVSSAKNYMTARDKLWAIQKNMRIMSEDLYLYAISSFKLPGHIRDSYKFLKQIKPSKDNPDNNVLLQRLLFLKKKNDVFGNSFLGIHTISLLEGLK